MADEEKSAAEQQQQGIADARNGYPDSSNSNIDYINAFNESVLRNQPPPQE